MRRALTVAVFSTLCASQAWASITACPSAGGTGTQTLDTINANSPTGCQLLDKQFSNFTSTPVGQTSTIEMLNTTTGGNLGANAITGLVLNFDAPGIWQLSPNSTTTSVLNYEGTIDPTFTPPPTTGAWTVSQISLVINFNPGNAAQFKNGDSITVRMEWCPGATTVTGCANLQFIQGILTKNPTLTLTYSNSLGNTNSFMDVSSFGATSNFAVRNTLTFNGTANGSTFVLTGISNGFDELGIAPEPTTFAMFGIALAGLGALRYRRRKTV